MISDEKVLEIVSRVVAEVVGSGAPAAVYAAPSVSLSE